jgi:hypothetical protein
MKRLAFVTQMVGVALIVVGVAVFSIPVAGIVFGALLIAAGEVHG